MKREWWAAGILAAAMSALALLEQGGPGGAGMMYALAAPFVWAGAGLRALSLAGAVGNALAILLYALLSLSPLWPLVIKSRRQRKRLFMWTMPAMSAYLFFLLYFMVNPSLIPALFHPIVARAQDVLPVLRVMLCLLFYLLLITRWVLGALVDTRRLPLQLKRLLYMFGAGMIVSVFYVNLAALRQAWGGLSMPPADAPLGLGAALNPQADGAVLPAEAVMSVLRFLADSAPTLLLFTVLPMAGNLLDRMEHDLFGEGNQQCAAAIARRCRLVLLVSLGCMLGFGALQLLLARWLPHVNISGQVPLGVVGLSLAMMLLSRYLEQSCAVYRENQMMI